MCLGIPGQITAILDANAMLAEVSISGVRRTVDVVCVAPPDGVLAGLIGQWVLVHVGFAMSVIDAGEAAETLKILAGIGELASVLTAMREGAGS